MKGVVIVGNSFYRKTRKLGMLGEGEGRSLE